MTKTLSLGISPCPNDTFIFYALLHQLVDCGHLNFEPHIHDVETLNQEAKKGDLDITKLSIAAFGQVRNSYRLLSSGAALGRGCGPLLVARKDKSLDDLAKGEIAVPGKWTTANLLLGLYLQSPLAVHALPFEQIMPEVQAGAYDYGVIIHEGRFTYPNYDLQCLLDLGKWWEEKTELPIPLGGIAISREHEDTTARMVERYIRESLRYAYKYPYAPQEFIRKNAQELSSEVIDQHIRLYVNEFTMELGREGKEAILRLLALAEEADLIPKSRVQPFV
jgi:1,4-dihydroxy-6-naphthoate synthase